MTAVIIRMLPDHIHPARREIYLRALRIAKHFRKLA